MVDSRVKGHSFERQIAKAIRDWPGVARATRELQYRQDHARPDVIVDLDCGVILAVECKRTKAWPVTKPNWIQCESQRAVGIPVLVTKQDQGPILCTITIDDLRTLIERTTK